MQVREQFYPPHCLPIFTDKVLQAFMPYRDYFQGSKELASSQKGLKKGSIKKSLMQICGTNGMYLRVLSKLTL